MFERLKVLLCIINEEHNFHELFKTSSDEKFWAFSFQMNSMSFPMFGANVNLLVLVLFFNNLISRSWFMCWFSFSCVCVMVICILKSTKPLVFVLFLHMFALWSFANFSRLPNLQFLFSFFLCLLFHCLQVFQKYRGN